MLLRAIVFSAALASAGAIAAAPAGRAPTGKWIVNFADAQCIAYRDYGTGPNPLRLVVKSPPVGDVMQVAVLREAGRSPAEQLRSTIAIDGRPLKTKLMAYTPKGSEERVYVVNMPSARFAEIRQAQSLSVRADGLDETFALSQMEPLLRTMDTCVSDLRRVWNIGPDGAEPVGLKDRARADLLTFFSDEDYPGIVVETSQEPILDSQACAVLKSKARFEPAHGRDGQPAKDAMVGSVTWSLGA